LTPDAAGRYSETDVQNAADQHVKNEDLRKEAKKRQREEVRTACVAAAAAAAYSLQSSSYLSLTGYGKAEGKLAEILQ
jgi:hypothetical protein